MANASNSTKKETIEYDEAFLMAWNQFCDSKGFSKRQAAHAARVAFMELLDANQREEVMTLAMPYVVRSRKKNGNHAEITTSGLN